MFDDFISSIGSLFGGGDNAAQTSSGNPPAQPQQGGGGDMLSSILLGVGAPLLTKLMGAGQDKQINEATKNLQAGSDTAGIGKALLDRASQGKLTDPQQEQVDSMKREQNARNAQYPASL